MPKRQDDDELSNAGKEALDAADKEVTSRKPGADQHEASEVREVHSVSPLVLS